MKTAYRICVIAPKGYIHSQCFFEVAGLLKASFDSLDIECDAKLNEFSPERINIVLGGHLLKEPLAGNVRYIPYQLEQLNAEGSPDSEAYRRFLANALEVWDYSLENIEVLKAQKITARHLPVGYHPLLEQIPPSPGKDVDVLFIGSIGPRRQPVLERLSQLPDVKTKVLFGVYGPERDAWVSRAKILLNIHYYPAKIFEAVRISYLLNNNCFVLSEESAVNPYPGVDICLTPYENLVEACRHYTLHNDEREQKRLQTYNQFREKYPMVEFLKAVVESQG